MQALTIDATSALLRALRQFVHRGSELRFEEIRSRSWASATFAGARHELAVSILGSEAENEAAQLADWVVCGEFSLSGHIVADIAIVAREPVAGDDGPAGVRLRIEALTVENG